MKRTEQSKARGWLLFLAIILLTISGCRRENEISDSSKSLPTALGDEKMIVLTSVFVDLIDNYNQFRQPLGGGKVGQIHDNVTGYTLQSLEEILKQSYGQSSLQRALKANKPVGVTDAQIDELMNDI